MNDMKKKLDFKVLAIMGVVVFSACGSDSDLFNPERRQLRKRHSMHRLLCRGMEKLQLIRIGDLG